MQTPEYIKTNLSGFTGTEQYHRFSLLWRNVLLTDGAKFLADNAECFWLFDIIASAQLKNAVKAEEFQVWNLVKTGSKAIVKASNGNDDNQIYTQAIPYTDFPLDSIKLYAIRDFEGTLIVMLTSEY